MYVPNKEEYHFHLHLTFFLKGTSTQCRKHLICLRKNSLLLWWRRWQSAANKLILNSNRPAIMNSIYSMLLWTKHWRNTILQLMAQLIWRNCIEHWFHLLPHYDLSFRKVLPIISTSLDYYVFIFIHLIITENYLQMFLITLPYLKDRIVLVRNSFSILIYRYVVYTYMYGN